jgi:hypothetical protein
MEGRHGRQRGERVFAAWPHGQRSARKPEACEAREVPVEGPAPFTADDRPILGEDGRQTAGHET